MPYKSIVPANEIIFVFSHIVTEMRKLNFFQCYFTCNVSGKFPLKLEILWLGQIFMLLLPQPLTKYLRQALVFI